MGDTTGIEWTDHTFNPWWGCVRVSPACEHCYAETFAKRFGVEWGVKAERKMASEKVWAAPLRWNRAAEKAGVRARVFCASMADVFEDRRDLDALRERLFALIAQTPWLDWQLLTKRPEAVMALVPESWSQGVRGVAETGFPPNVWVGTTVEDRRRADARVPHLLAIPAAVRFLSCEPLLGALDLSQWLGGYVLRTNDGRWLRNTHPDAATTGGTWLRGIEWVIGGGESGHGARPTHLGWARSLLNQCAEAGVPFFWKQWGEWAPGNDGPGGDILPIASGCKASGFWTYNDDWIGAAGAEGLNPFRQTMVRVGKKTAGAILDGVEHKHFPGAR